jgi:hypothetical protein
MKPTPLGKTYLEYETELKEYNLAKTELAMQKIELGVVQDAIKNVEAAEKLFEEGFLVVSFARTKAIPMIKNSITNAKKFLAQFEQTKKAAKELGIDLPQEYLKLERKAGVVVGEAEDIITWLNKY